MLPLTPDRARRVASEAHDGQTDKAGRAYVRHPIRVAARLDDPDAQVVAYLHDVLEDTRVSVDDLRGAGVTERQLEAVIAITHPPGLDDETYWRSVRAVPLARIVKIADIADNTDPRRTARLDGETAVRLRGKYRRALAVLLWDDGPEGRTEPVERAAYERILGDSLATLGPDVLTTPPAD